MKGVFNQTRGFGVEIEYSRPAVVTNQDIASRISARGIDCRVEGYNHETRRWWKIVSDSSVRATTPDQIGRNEIVSPILSGENNGFIILNTVLEVLNDLGCTVNASCGLHVHHDVRPTIREAQKKDAQAFIEKTIKFVAKFEHCIYKLIAPSRLSRQFSTPVRKTYYVDGAPMYSLMNGGTEKNEKVKKQVKACVGGERMSRTQYSRTCGLNMYHVFTRGSIEFRYHQGSLNYEKISNWIVVTQMMLNAVESKRTVHLSYVDGGRKGMGKFRKALGLDKTSCGHGQEANEWMKKTFTKFNRREADYTRARDYEYVMGGV